MKHTEAMQFSFKPGHQCHEVVFILRRIVEICIEWNVPIFILYGDISKAYDFTQHDKVMDTLLSRGANHLLTAAIMREQTRKSCKLRLGDKISKKNVARNRALWQGDPYAPHLFNATLDRIAVRFCATAASMKWGMPCKRGEQIHHLCLLLFADNY